MNKEKKVNAPKEKSVRALNRSRRLRHGTMATVLSVCFVAAVVLVNVIVSILVERYPLTVDLTSNKVFELSQESIDYVSGLDKDINVYVLATKRISPATTITTNRPILLSTNTPSILTISRSATSTSIRTSTSPPVIPMNS